MPATNLSTPRTAEVDLIGSIRGDTPCRETDAGVREAFLAFHRKHITGRPAARFRTPLLSSGSWMFVALAVIGLGGGLFLAATSFNQPETSSIVGARPPEMIYLPPTTDGKPAIAVADAADAAGERVGSAADNQVAQAEAGTPLQAESRDAQSSLGGYIPADVNEWDMSLGSERYFSNATANFDAAMRYSAAGYALGSESGDGTDAGYGAIELPSVPEPSTGVVVCLGLALLVGVTHLKKRRT